MTKALFYKKIEEIDCNFFSKENMTKHNSFVYKLDTELNDMYSTYLATI